MALQGKIIEYLENGKFICAFVLENSGRRLRSLNQNGRNVSLPFTRVVHHSKKSFPLNLTRDEILKQLRFVSETRQELMASVSLQEIWNLVSEEIDNLYEPSFLAELCFGKDADDDRVASFLRSIFLDKLFFKYKEGKIISHSPKVVEQLRLMLEKEKQKEDFLAKGTVYIDKLWREAELGKCPERDLVLDLVQNYYLFGNEAPQHDLARELLKRSQLTKPQDGFHLLVKAGVWDKNENIPLLRNNINTTFSKAALRQIDSLTEHNLEILIKEGRKDFRDLPVLTIDGENTRDFDDALHIEIREENFLVGVHISDVAYYVKPDDPLFQEALTRGTSLYFPEGTVPMLPEVISEGICSLIAGKPRPTLSFMVLLSPEGEMLEYSITPSVINVQRQLSYKKANLLIGKDEELTSLSRISLNLRKRRLEAGALLLPFPDVNISIASDGLIDIILSEVDTPSRILISEFMILANTLAAQFIADREMAGLFRSQPPPRQRLVEGNDKDLFVNIRQRKNLSPMTLSTKPKTHSGLGVPQYTTITSPMRRLLDLTMQHQILHHLKGKGTLFTKKDLKRIADTITNLLARANAAKQQRHRYWILKYLEPKTGERLNGLIIDKGPRLLHLLLVDFMLDTELPANRAITAEPGRMISVKLTKADALNNILKVEW